MRVKASGLKVEGVGSSEPENQRESEKTRTNGGGKRWGEGDEKSKKNQRNIMKIKETLEV